MQGNKHIKAGIKVVDDRTTDGLARGRIEAIEKGIDDEELNAVLRRSIRRRAETFLQHGQRTIYAHDLKKTMEKREHIFLLDIRLNEDYAAGHIPGSMNVEFIDVMEPHTLMMLPTDRTPIVIICYTGHTASELNSILNLLGYNAWTLRFGMMSWNSLTRTSVWSSRDSQDVIGGGFCVEASEYQETRKLLLRRLP